MMTRVSQEQKRLFQRAAEIRGQTLTEFVVAAAQEAATRAIVDQQVIELSVQDSRAFAGHLSNLGGMGSKTETSLREQRWRASKGERSVNYTGRRQRL